MSTTVNLSDGSERQTPYPIAIFFAIASLALVLLLTPPLVSHFKNRNIGATVLVAAAIAGNMMNFLNATIWSTDDVASWYTGAIYCDIQIKLMVVLSIMYTSSVAMILRGLAQIMNTNSSSWSISAAKKRRDIIIDLVCCVVLPMFQMLAQWITQPWRYYILGIAGCTPATDGSWLYILLSLLPPLFWTAVDVYYSIILLIRLIRYRRAFNTIMMNNNTTKSRFLRLYLLSTLCVIALIPGQVFVFVTNVSPGVTSFSWNAVHHPTEYSWDSVIMVPSGGKTFYDRWFCLVGSVLIFAFFGFGRDAVKTYRDLLLGIGMGRVIPSLKPGHISRRDTQGTFSSFNSKARLYFGKRKDSGSVTTSATDSMRSATLASTTQDLSSGGSPFHSMNEKPNSSSSRKPSMLASFFGKTPRKHSNSNDPFVMTTYNRQAMIQSNVSAEPRSPNSRPYSRSFSSEDVMVRTELRQASETVEPLSSKKLYEGV
ncbi:uncharacterized protein RCC_07746 [Ramularia collo-cygni]|uniref:Uncharacterized protein n=1 Tax=Ramularia collo-cygni TaxID=112498 RepID=A0A2D3V8W4_9PEZI|nr:uncharacterized protein RCC_07746 [Ramularia collo-cygni]CZT21880.1 uncharacterized protein RCC_07746 [Ramularia collo-cygni]